MNGSFDAACWSDPCSGSRPPRPARRCRRRSPVEFGTPGCARPLPRLPHPPQPLHEHRVVGECLRPVDERVEELVVPGRRHVEQLPDRLFLGPRELPPLPLEREDLAFPRRQLPGHRRFLRHCVCGVHSNPPAVRQRHDTFRTTTLSFPPGPSSPPRAGRRRSRAREESRGLPTLSGARSRAVVTNSRQYRVSRYTSASPCSTVASPVPRRRADEASRAPPATYPTSRAAFPPVSLAIRSARADGSTSARDRPRHATQPTTAAFAMPQAAVVRPAARRPVTPS